MEKYDLLLDIDEDLLKVAHFISRNIEPARAIKLTRWLADIAPLIWPEPTEKERLHDRPMPLGIIERLHPPTDGHGHA